MPGPRLPAPEPDRAADSRRVSKQERSRTWSRQSIQLFGCGGWQLPGTTFAAGLCRLLSAELCNHPFRNQLSESVVQVTFVGKSHPQSLFAIQLNDCVGQFPCRLVKYIYVLSILAMLTHAVSRLRVLSFAELSYFLSLFISFFRSRIIEPDRIIYQIFDIHYWIRKLHSGNDFFAFISSCRA
jgi:hypothetical protein